MQTLPHLAKRGNVYQWRRRSRRQSTGIVDIKLSLGTTDARTAAILSRRVSAESDIVMESIAGRQITAEEGRKWLANVVQLERAKIERLQMLRRFDSKDPDDDLRHDHATRSAWQHIADHGLNADLPADVPRDDPRRKTLDLIRADLSADSRARIVARDFRELTGRGDISAMGLVTLMNLLIEGKVAAWTSSDRVLEPLAEVAEQLCQDDPGVLGAASPPTADSAELAPRSSTLYPGHATASEQNHADMPDSEIIAVTHRMIEVKRVENIEEKTLRQYESFVSLFTRLTGITDLRLLQQNQVKAFRADLGRIPKSWGKSPRDQDATRAQIMARAELLPAEQVGLSVGTINRHLEHLNQIVEWARDEGIPLDPRLKPAKLRRKDPVRDRDKRKAFTEPELVTMFQSPVWQGSYSERFQTRQGHIIYKNGIYWCPLIGAYTGARREEIAGLMVADIGVQDDVHCFIIEDSEIRRIKNISSKRIVPIHPRLIELGFLTHVRKQEAQGHATLFPDLREPATGQHGRKLGRRMRQIIDNTLGPSASGLSFHSLRHYVQHTLEDDPDIKNNVIRDILGHEGEDVHEKTYGKRATVLRLQEAINRLPKVF